MAGSQSSQPDRPASRRFGVFQDLSERDQIGESGWPFGQTKADQPQKSGRAALFRQELTLLSQRFVA